MATNVTGDERGGMLRALRAHFDKTPNVGIDSEAIGRQVGINDSTHARDVARHLLDNGLASGRVATLQHVVFSGVTDKGHRQLDER